MLVVTLPGNGNVTLIQRNLYSLWDFIVPPEDFPKFLFPELQSNADALRYVEGISKTPGMRWVGFDPESYINLSDDQTLEQAAIDGATLASDEVLMAMALFSDWVKCWDGKRCHHPKMPTYRFEGAPKGWHNNLSVYRNDGDRHCCGSGRQLELGTDVGNTPLDIWSSPTVRKL